jgi:hypothetical protein
MMKTGFCGGGAAPVVGGGAALSGAGRFKIKLSLLVLMIAVFPAPQFPTYTRVPPGSAAAKRLKRTPEQESVGAVRAIVVRKLPSEVLSTVASGVPEDVMLAT